MSIYRRLCPLVAASVLVCAGLGGCAHLPEAVSLPPGVIHLPVAGTDPDTPFALSPAGDQLAYVAGGLRLSGATAAHATRVAEETPTQLAWAPDGATLAAAFRQGEESRLRLYTADGTPLGSADISGSVSALAWRSSTELLVGAVVMQSFRFGTNVKQILYRWDGSSPPLGNVLHETTVRPYNVKSFGGYLTLAFRLAVAPLGDEFVYSRIQDPPEFAPYLKLMLRHLVTGRERELVSVSLNAGRFAITADGEHLLYGDGKGNTYRRNIWDEGIDEIIPSPGRVLAAAAAGETVFIDGSVRQGGTVVASFPAASDGALSARGDRLLVRSEGRLWLVSGLPEVASPPLTVQQRERLLTLRQWRSEEVITPAEFQAAVSKLLGSP